MVVVSLGGSIAAIIIGIILLILASVIPAIPQWARTLLYIVGAILLVVGIIFLLLGFLGIVLALGGLLPLLLTI